MYQRVDWLINTSENINSQYASYTDAGWTHGMK